MKTIFYNSKDIHWRIPSRERLFHRLGEYDTMAEFTVLSELHFESLCRQSGDFANFVNTKAEEFNVKIRCGVSLENYREALYKSFMVNSHAMFNDFIYNFKDDLKLYVQHDFSMLDNNKLSTYERLEHSMENNGFNLNIPSWLDDVVSYYRLIRNHVAHNDNDDKECHKAYNKIDLNKMLEDYPVFSGKAPNPPGQITIEDFYLYSASIKHVANLLSISIQGHEKWSSIGQHHPRLQRANIPSGTDKRKLVHLILNELGHKCIKEEVDKILDDVRNQYKQ